MATIGILVNGGQKLVVLVRTETSFALVRGVVGVLFLLAYHHGDDLVPENLLKSSRNFFHYIQRKPARQLHLCKDPMKGVNLEFFGIASQDLEHLPTDRTTGF